MGDERIRELERRSGEGEEEGALLRELQRRGLLSEGRLRILGYVGEPGAVALLEKTCPQQRRAKPGSWAERSPAGRLRQWILGLADVCDPEDRLPITRACLAALAEAGHGRPRLDPQHENPWAVIQLPADHCRRILWALPEDREDPLTRSLETEVATELQELLRQAVRAWAMQPPDA